MDTLRDKILDIAHDEIYSNGYSATGLNKILKVANVAKGGLYHHFNSKKELLIAIINERICPNSLKKYDLLDKEENKLESLLEILETRKDNFDKGCPLGNLILELSNIDEEILKALQKCINSWRVVFEKVIQEEIDKKKIKLVSAYDSSLFIISTIQGGLLLSKLTKSNVEYKKCIEQLKLYFSQIKE